MSIYRGTKTSLPLKRDVVKTVFLNSKMQQVIHLILSTRVKVHSVGREAKWMVSICFTIVSAEANMIEAVLKTMFEFVFKKKA